MMNRMGFSETIFLFFLALIIFGPKKLPEIARQVGKYLNEFKRASNEFKAQIEQEIAHLEVENKLIENKKEAENKPTILLPSEPPEGTTSRSWNSPAIDQLPAANPATLAASTDEPILSDISGNGSEPPIATEAIPVSESVTSPDALTTAVSRESHA